MKKKLITLLLGLSILVASTAFAVTTMKVMFMSISPFGGAYAANSVEMPTMDRPTLQGALGFPTRSYGYCDVWTGFDQIYVAYYDVYGNTTTALILPVTSW